MGFAILLAASLCAGMVVGICPTMHRSGRSGLRYPEPRKRSSVQAVVHREKVVISIQRVRADHKIRKNTARTRITMASALQSVRLKSATRSTPKDHTAGRSIPQSNQQRRFVRREVAQIWYCLQGRACISKSFR